MRKTESRTSPRSSRRGCLCPDGTYSTDCCDGSLQAQGIGNLKDQSTSTIVKIVPEFDDAFDNAFSI